MTKSTNTETTNKGIAKSTYFLSLAVAVLLTAGITAIGMYFATINQFNDVRADVVKDLKAVSIVLKNQ